MRQITGFISLFVSQVNRTVLSVCRKEQSPEFAFIKRAFDIVSSGVALILLSPPILITGMAIKISDGGPIFYRQTRLTRDGKEFIGNNNRTVKNTEKHAIYGQIIGENEQNQEIHKAA